MDDNSQTGGCKWSQDAKASKHGSTAPLPEKTRDAAVKHRGEAENQPESERVKHPCGAWRKGNLFALENIPQGSEITKDEAKGSANRNCKTNLAAAVLGGPAGSSAISPREIRAEQTGRSRMRMTTDQVQENKSSKQAPTYWVVLQPQATSGIYDKRADESTKLPSDKTPSFYWREEIQSKLTSGHAGCDSLQRLCDVDNGGCQKRGIPQSTKGTRVGRKELKNASQHISKQKWLRSSLGVANQSKIKIVSELLKAVGHKEILLVSGPGISPGLVMSDEGYHTSGSSKEGLPRKGALNKGGCVTVGSLVEDHSQLAVGVLRNGRVNGLTGLKPKSECFRGGLLN